jgi:ATP-dependent Clp protease adaptor protein ClpS
MSDTAVKSRDLVSNRIKVPSKYKVIILNDDKTPMEFVVALLIGVFKHSEPAAIDLTMKIHNEGSAVAGTYNFEIAEQKAVDATMLARNSNHPLVVKVEEE